MRPWNRVVADRVGRVRRHGLNVDFGRPRREYTAAQSTISTINGVHRTTPSRNSDMHASSRPVAVQLTARKHVGGLTCGGPPGQRCQETPSQLDGG